MRPGFTERLLARLAINIGAFFAAVEILPQIHSEAWEVTLLLGAAFALTTIILLPILSLIINLMSALTAAIYTIALNTGLLFAAETLADEIGVGFDIERSWWGLLGAFIISVIALIANAFFRQFVRGL